MISHPYSSSETTLIFHYVTIIYKKNNSAIYSLKYVFIRWKVEIRKKKMTYLHCFVTVCYVTTCNVRV